MTLLEKQFIFVSYTRILQSQNQQKTPLRLIVSTNKWHQLKSAALLPYLTKATLQAKWIYLLNFSNKIWLWSSSNDHLILSNMKGYDANLYPFIAFTSLQELHKEGHLIWKFVTLLKWVSHHHLKCVSGN